MLTDEQLQQIGYRLCFCGGCWVQEWYCCHKCKQAVCVFCSYKDDLGRLWCPVCVLNEVRR